MKTKTLSSLLWILMLVASVGCKKTTSPTPVPAPSSTTTLSPTETSLLGNWIYDKQELYNNGVLVTTPGGTVTFNDPAVYHLQFNSTVTTAPVNVTGNVYVVIDGTSGSDHQNYWQVTTAGKLVIGSATYSIDVLNANNLSYYTGSLVTGAAIKYSFHK